MREKYTFENLLTAIKSPSVLLGEAGRKVTRINRSYHRRMTPNRGIRVMDNDWDNLIILDGCRYDLFEQHHHQLTGELQKVVSRGSSSKEFIRENFLGGEFHDTVYVSSNPFTELVADKGIFHDIIDVFKTDWDEDFQTVTPDALTAATLAAREEFPHKRVISHFMQPHYPFIGETGQKFTHRGLTGEVVDDEQTSGRSEMPIWTELQYGLSTVSIEQVWQAYAENLEVALPHVKELIEEMDGKSVITADHGNMFGERLSPIPVRAYGHPGGLRAAELVDVPWFVAPFENRRSVRSDSPQRRRTANDDQEIVTSRLRDLGYV